jgi:Holliday junction resolvasome RuvABC endonuclease subunit
MGVRMSADVCVLGVDPGFASFGWCVMLLLPQGEQVLETEVIRTEKSSKKQNVRAADDDFRRSQEIALVLQNVVKRWRPQAVAAEAFSSPRNASAAAKVARAWGVLAGLCVASKLPLVQASPQDIKKVLCQNKTATKEQVQEVLKVRYPDGFLSFTQRVPKGKWEHGFDAAGAVVACLETDVFRMARRGGS